MDQHVAASLVSVITPTYNHERFIAQCIESVLAQTYGHWEMIIVDDGSTDHTASIAEEYAKKDHRIKVIRQANNGIFRLAETYNKALGLANGELIAILEGDDTWQNTKLEIQVDAMNHLCGAITFDDAAQGQFSHDGLLSENHLWQAPSCCISGGLWVSGA